MKSMISSEIFSLQYTQDNATWGGVYEDLLNVHLHLVTSSCGFNQIGLYTGFPQIMEVEPVQYLCGDRYLNRGLQTTA